MKAIFPIAAALVATLSQGSAVAAVHVAKNAQNIHARASDPCIFFSLEGVGVADPTIDPKPWFSLRKDHPHFAELYALLVTARAGKLPIQVSTSGEFCNAASVDLISLL